MNAELDKMQRDLAVVGGVPADMVSTSTKFVRSVAAALAQLREEVKLADERGDDLDRALVQASDECAALRAELDRAADVLTGAAGCLKLGDYTETAAQVDAAAARCRELAKP